MLIASTLFGVLFVFLVFVFSIFIASVFVKKKDNHFEPNVSVIVPAYNEENNIEECVNSILNSNYPKKKIEIIIVDDGSTDNTLKILKKFKNVEILKQNHQGKVEALNLGGMKSKHEFLVTIDADTILDKDCIKELVKPFMDKTVGATTGNNHVKNKRTFLSAFQNVEYHYSNLIRSSFSKVFKNGIWFSGSLAAYRKTSLIEIGYFKKDTMAEDQDVALELRKNKYRTVTTPKAFGYTVVPETLKAFYHQRSRWWIGTLQAILKNKELFSHKSSPSTLFVIISHYWWSFYAFLSLPLIIYQVSFWLPYNTQNFFTVFSYLFKWFSLMGPFYVIYGIPNNGISIYSIFGVLSGLITTFMCLISIKIFNDKINFKNLVAVFFYFPFTIVLNIIILISLLKHRFWKKSYYMK